MSNGTNDRFRFEEPVPPAAELGHVHFIAIGGAGMSGVARIMLAQGLQVTGSDARESLVTRALGTEGALVHIGHDASHLEGVDTVVLSSAIRDDNPELAAARQRGLRVLHRSQGLASVMRGQRRVAVAGANGKTTTTSMLTVALQHCGVDPSFAVGGELARLGTNAHYGTGDVFVAEADESDGSFVVYHPEVAIVTNVMPDHLDFYGDYAHVQQAYERFAGTIRPGGVLVTCADDPGARQLAERVRAGGTRVVSYGEAADADVRITGLGGRDLQAWATLHQAGAPDRALRIGVPGEHNLLNATAAYVAATVGLGQEPTVVLEGLAGFTGTRRRFEPKGEVQGVRVIDDYAHNPGKVTAVVRTGKRLVGDDGRLVVVFQPHLYTRTRDFAAELAQALSLADVVVVMEIFAAREDPLPGVTAALVADRVHGPGRVVYEPSWQAVAPCVAALVRPGDLVLTVGAGDVTLVGPEVLGLLAEQHAAEEQREQPAQQEQRTRHAEQAVARHLAEGIR
ncbi:MAG TPA: UDP-N-acetylmuramate--L-alanine ligase [Segeticoccus sp.]|uniref:UDP-N-acetylmuramate--L-alanine ligase n=1 Tax=Segeticoccus sp. TaxID=2706531 RepID=UPI002D7E2DDF|nr:UDP-N-acetylmuramate--L-alanine ligase [Segeticoccus sp.]HET8601880.1 UDP-N-acetylmuramate--L-alanine ligase [Segeticoccus sp.]